MLCTHQNLWHQKLYGKSLSSLTHQLHNSAGCSTLVEDPEVLKAQEQQQQQLAARATRVAAAAQAAEQCKEVNGISPPSQQSLSATIANTTSVVRPLNNNSNSRPLQHIKVRCFFLLSCAAVLLRGTVFRATPWKFTGTLCLAVRSTLIA